MKEARRREGKTGRKAINIIHRQKDIPCCYCWQRGIILLGPFSRYNNNIQLITASIGRPAPAKAAIV